MRSQTCCALLALTYAPSLAERKRLSQQVEERWFRLRSERKVPPRKSTTPLKAACDVTLTVADFASVAAMADKDVYNHFMSLCGRSATRIVPPAVKWDRFRVVRSKDSVSVCLFKRETEAFRLSFVPPGSA